jgi:hypothetical protein
MIENSYMHATKERVCISCHLIKLLMSFLLFVSSDKCCTPWNDSGSILRYGVLSDYLGHCSSSLALDYRGLGIYFPRVWYYRNSAVLIPTWNTQIRNTILKFTHGCILNIILLRRVSQFRRIHNLSNQKSYHKRWKLYLWVKILSEKCMLWSRSRITAVSMRTFEEARGYRKK